MHDERHRIEERVERVHTQRIKPAIYAASVPFDVEAWQAPGEPVPFEEAAGASYAPFAMDTPWGPPWGTTWFRMRGQVPAEWAGRRVEAVIDLGFVGDWPGNQAEALVHLTDGTPLKAVNPLNQYVPIGNPVRGGETIDYLVEAASNPDILADNFSRPTPLGDVLTAGDKPLYTFRRADIAILDEEVFHLDLDLQVLRGLMVHLGEHEPRRHEILHTLDRAMDAVDLDDIAGSATAVREILAPALAKPAHASAHTVSGVGHAHIDSAWLWPIRETKRKTSRTFSNVTALADEYEDFIFACSQAVQYEWVRDNYPQVWERIKKAVDKGQWVPVGGMWVESDGNLPGGEAIARQLVHGKRFFIEHFGIETKGVWLPDSFGYNASYPQLAKLAGNDWFLTQKISWNQTNRFPHHTFWWEGIDGTRIFTHFPPIDTYNARFSGEEMDRAVRNYAEKGAGTRSLAPFGWGDGGGGPTREIMERARRLADLEGSPKVVVEHPDEFFAKARAEYEDAPVWNGELYLELHRATYTSQARTKQGNRHSEHKLREAELWATTAALNAPGYAYPYEKLDRLWKTVLLHQFHDILPGSSIAWVHREAEAEYARVAKELEVLTAEAVAALGSGDTRVFNTSPRDRAEVVRTPAGAPAYVTVPANGSAPLAAAEPPHPVTVSGRILDNGLVRVEIAEDGTLASVRDLVADREVLGDKGNLLRLHTDLPNYWDAWDVDKHYRNRFTDLLDPASVTVVEEDPLLGAVRVEHAFGKGSRISQTITLRAGSRRIDFETDIDWHEAEKFLKAGFPIDVRAAHSSAEIQFGHIQRPTHTNTTWEAARFEVSGHRWVHVGEPGYGVAVINDSTYGHDVTRTVREDGGTTTTVRLSLVRAPRIPDPEADQGKHRLVYSLLPGATIEDAVAEGYALNLPLRVADAAGASAPVVSVDGDGVTVEAVKLADDASGDVVVRIYESSGGRARGVLRTGFPLAGARITDLLERPLSEAATEGDGVPVTLRPFEVQTLRLAVGER
ncbi:glycoside hydrolase family 38 C-terminal domain-containing protein [Streptomyces scabiei]|uniref:alpha-mannosidase n=1 Tax=Streptomyces scabiei TaxID=1930 RepID=UPI0029B03D42|nr:glycoside hydrolase family 38 C-terminal domain-containing protein [Streptomyces scabiei]MDX2574623.1 glycoside hydrolase family 38 C-terminal domain-containing protein [Streptomyces scabiei]MDX2992720.1 glycoside hydrolase family 38 C-terminal domain-containing protein [Streptomyces scabiei]MDX3049172.1 glycoside hydrolase family 38 C-terminal domain-containing protein [Streptomyces scabiei]MDX3597646.1 glycoside hydrolase family 38 C-terminal domain-containing protein [Streptomyces scabiei